MPRRIARALPIGVSVAIVACCSSAATPAPVRDPSPQTHLIEAPPAMLTDDTSRSGAFLARSDDGHLALFLGRVSGDAPLRTENAYPAAWLQLTRGEVDGSVLPRLAWLLGLRAVRDAGAAPAGEPCESCQLAVQLAEPADEELLPEWSDLGDGWYLIYPGDSLGAEVVRSVVVEVPDDAMVAPAARSLGLFVYRFRDGDRFVREHAPAEPAVAPDAPSLAVPLPGLSLPSASEVRLSSIVGDVRYRRDTDDVFRDLEAEQESLDEDR